MADCTPSYIHSPPTLPAPTGWTVYKKGDLAESESECQTSAPTIRQGQHRAAPRHQCRRKEQTADEGTGRDVRGRRLPRCPDYIQSGNVIFRAEPALAMGIPSLISESIMERFGYRVPVVVRTARELQEVVEVNPFAQTNFEANRLLILFLADLPDRARVESLDPDRSPGDEFAVVGREVFVHYPNGVARRQAHQRLLRLQALDHQHRPKLENGQQAPRVGHRGWLSRGTTRPKA